MFKVFTNSVTLICSCCHGRLTWISPPKQRTVGEADFSTKAKDFWGDCGLQWSRNSTQTDFSTKRKKGLLGWLWVTMKQKWLRSRFLHQKKERTVGVTVGYNEAGMALDFKTRRCGICDSDPDYWQIIKPFCPWPLADHQTIPSTSVHYFGSALMETALLL